MKPYCYWIDTVITIVFINLTITGAYYILQPVRLSTNNFINFFIYVFFLILKYILSYNDMI